MFGIFSITEYIILDNCICIYVMLQSDIIQNFLYTVSKLIFRVTFHLLTFFDRGKLNLLVRTLM